MKINFREKDCPCSNNNTLNTSSVVNSAPNQQIIFVEKQKDCTTRDDSYAKVAGCASTQPNTSVALQNHESCIHQHHQLHQTCCITISNSQCCELQKRNIEDSQRETLLEQAKFSGPHEGSFNNTKLLKLIKIEEKPQPQLIIDSKFSFNNQKSFQGDQTPTKYQQQNSTNDERESPLKSLKMSQSIPMGGSFFKEQQQQCQSEYSINEELISNGLKTLKIDQIRDSELRPKFIQPDDPLQFYDDILPDERETAK